MAEFRSLVDTLLGPRESLTEAEIAQFSASAAKARNMANTLVTPSEADLARLYRESFPALS